MTKYVFLSVQRNKSTLNSFLEATYVIVKKERTGNLNERYYDRPLGKFEMFLRGVFVADVFFSCIKLTACDTALSLDGDRLNL